MADREVVEQRIETRHAPLPVGLVQLEDRPDIVLDVHAAEDRGFLGQIADAETRAPIHRQLRDVAAVEHHPAAVRGEEAGDYIKRVVLPAPFGPSSPTASPGPRCSDTSRSTARPR